MIGTWGSQRRRLACRGLWALGLRRRFGGFTQLYKRVGGPLLRNGFSGFLHNLGKWLPMLIYIGEVYGTILGLEKL